MMKYLYFDNRMKRYLLLIIIAVIPALGFTQNSFPDYWSVVTKFFSQYHHENSNEATLSFAKKKDGWFVELFNQYKGDSLVSSQLFWSPQKGRYQVLESFVGANTDPLQTKALSFINTSVYSAYGYARCIYYGYNGWDIDLLKDYENVAIKSDTLLEGLARAYGAYASRYLWYQFGGGNIAGDPLQKKLGRLELPGEERAKKVADYISRAAATYQKLYEKNKLYETLVGNIGMKYFNENFHGYIQLMMCNKPAEAAGFLSKCRLPQNDSIAAANLLNSIEKNGILFTYGDNDTYPPMYLQAKHNFRKDVAVLNISLLGFTPYLEMLKREKIVQFLTTAAEYGNPDIEYAFYYPQKEDLRKQKLSQFVAGHKRLKKVAAVGGDSVKVYDAKYLYLLLADTINIELDAYVTMGDFLLLDIINENTGKRPIFFTRPFPPYFRGYLKRSGIAYKLHDKAYDFTKGDTSEFRHLQSYINDSYRAPFVEFTNHSSDYNSNVEAHLNLFLPVIHYYMKEANPSAARKLIAQCFSYFGANTPYVPFPDDIIPILCVYGFESLADKIADTHIQTVERFNREKINTAYYDNETARSQLESLKQVLEKNNRSLSSVDAALSRLRY